MEAERAPLRVVSAVEEAVRVPSRAQVAEVVIVPSAVWAVGKVRAWQVNEVCPAAVAVEASEGGAAEVVDAVVEAVAGKGKIVH